MMYFALSRKPGVITAWPVSHVPILEQAFVSSLYPAAEKIAPQTPLPGAKITIGGVHDRVRIRIGDVALNYGDLFHAN
jgi:hypothetical protein